MPSLRLLRDDCDYLLGELASEPLVDQGPEEWIDAWELYCLALINSGYVGLLADADPKKFAQQLARAGANWAVLLRRAQRSGFVVPASKNAPLIGLMAIDDLTGAAELAQLSATQPQPLEYPDEFLGALVFQQLVTSLHAGGVDRALLRQTVDLLRAESDALRTEVYAAIVNDERDAFWAAFEAAGREHRAAMKKLQEAMTVPHLRFRAARFVWLEGLALVRIASRLGYGDPEVLPAIPPLALKAKGVRDDGQFLLARS